ncbi:hypothetical protein EII31_01590 [Leucobacter sp. OH2974_COT-288]|nr:hypothetical protein EII31_01590 [Leucobacter sp. OH2974_COT-288]
MRPPSNSSPGLKRRRRLLGAAGFAVWALWCGSSLRGSSLRGSSLRGSSLRGSSLRAPSSRGSSSRERLML